MTTHRLPISHSLLWPTTMALATAFLLTLSFPGYQLSFLAWVAPAPLLAVIAGGVTFKRALWLGWLSGIVFTFLAESWIAHSMVYFGGILTIIAYAVALLFAAILAIFPALFAAVMSKLTRNFGPPALALAPFVWVATEWVRPIITGVTWNALGISQAQFFPIARLSRYGGVYLISAEIVAASALLVLLVRIREKNVARVASMLLMTAGVILVLPKFDDQTPLPAGVKVTVVGVQPNLPPDSSDAFARDLENCMRLTREGIERAPDKKADFVVWAESPLALFYENDPVLRRRLDQFAHETGSYLFLNTVTREEDKYFNSINTLSPDLPDPNETNNIADTKTPKRYDKIRLVPFGEYVPLRPVLGRFIPAIVGEFTPGRDAVVNALKLEASRTSIIATGDLNSPPAIQRTTDYVRVGSFICYEAAYPHLVRRFVRNGASLLINVSNDAWFGNTAGARQHLLHAMMRAIENDRDLIRVTNTGISAMVTSDGRIVGPLPVSQAGAQVWQAQTRRGQTLYARFGDWFAMGCVLISLFALAVALIKPSR